MYVNRNDNGHITLVSREATPDCREFLSADSPELLAFLSEGEVSRGQAYFQASDLAFVRILEDVIELLVDKKVISFTELPEAARQRMMERQALRRRPSGLSLVGADDEEGGAI
ncbi:tryptophan synthase subunit beta like protein [Halomonas sp. BM-2019]|uniref:tryptophan synthase subunit beta like protein n=1 Tax=Halomonas sp. BM-2019 TaxID=2811227 RepID=UPI001B3C1AC5|nr:MAG: tryptophan synthase subunit beta like protein [Halomonas sp. BM-2019]